MTSDKYQHEHHCPLEERVKGIEGDVRDIRKMAVGMYDKLGGLAETMDAVYKTVSYHQPDGSAGVPDDDWDFLDEED